jgi:hypothetical protein
VSQVIRCDSCKGDVPDQFGTLGGLHVEYLRRLAGQQTEFDFCSWLCAGIYAAKVASGTVEGSYEFTRIRPDSTPETIS